MDDDPAVYIIDETTVFQSSFPFEIYFYGINIHRFSKNLWTRWKIWPFFSCRAECLISFQTVICKGGLTIFFFLFSTPPTHQILKNFKGFQLCTFVIIGKHNSSQILEGICQYANELASPSCSHIHVVVTWGLLP